MKKNLLLIAIFVNTLFADSEDLFDALKEMTEIATKTKLNIDYVPGTVSIIHGEELKAMGVTNLAQLNAYDMVIGMESVVSSLRGVGSMYGANGNKIKWLLNGKVIETELKETDDWGKGTVFIPLPVDFIDRIEFIRGPGSAIYGGNAIFGVINIITKKSKNGIFAGFEYLGGDNKGKHIGAYASIEKNDLSIDLSASKYISDGYDLYVGLDGHFYDHITGNQTPGYGPGKLPANSKADTLMADFNYKGVDLWAYHFSTKTGQGYVDWYPTDTLPPDDGRYVKESTNTLLGIKKEFIFNDLVITPQIGVSIYENPADKYFKWPIGFTLPKDTVGFSEEKFRSREYKEQKNYAKIDLKYESELHTLSGGLFIQKTKILKDKTFRNYVIGRLDIKDWFEHTGLLKTKEERTQKAIYIQDIFDINDKLTITAGIRYDDFNDIDSAYSPRVAGVYSINENHILKAQFSKSFRPPSFFETYGYMSPYILKPELVDTIEVGYIYKYDGSHFKATIFDSKMKNMIIQHYQSYYFENLKEIAKVRGVELEYKWKNRNIEIGLNGAFYDTHNKETLNDFSLSSKFMGNANIKYIFSEGHYLNLWYHYLSKKPLLENSSNGYLDAQDYLNATYKISFNDIEFDIGVRNLFDKVQETLYMPLNPRNSEGIPYMGQSFWVNLTYNF